VRWFNTTGPNRPEQHYTLPEREGVPDFTRLIRRQQYFLVHAPRQTGKTTAMRKLAAELTASGDHAALHVSFEIGQAYTDSSQEALESALLQAIRRQADIQLPEALRPPPWPTTPAGALGEGLAVWARQCPLPLVLLIDEIDALRDDGLVLVLRQLRTGFVDRPEHFPASIGLVGLRDVRDYVVASGGEGRLGSGSPFNIKASSVRIGDFTAAEVGALLAQHTADTGQTFSEEAVRQVFALSQGQPWLVNALAAELVDEITRDREPVLPTHVDEARARLVRRQDTHLDQLAVRLSEPRVRAIVEPMMAGSVGQVFRDEDVRYVVDLGLMRHTVAGGLEVSNPIYRDIVARTLAASPRANLPQIAPSWLQDGVLDPDALLAAFLAFWRRHGQPLLGTAPYAEIAPHLVLMAFLDRVANGGGRVEREYALGRGRLDLLLVHGDVRLPMELKVWAPGRPDPAQAGLDQLDGDITRLGERLGWLVVFDRRDGLPAPEHRTEAHAVTLPSGRVAVVIRA
jgi:type II secretory pathway predicted ATPase ExeA